MPVARIVLFTVPVETSPVTTHFQIQYNTDGGTTWTTYNPSSTDISVSTLVANVYTLDGINSPAGNTAAASYAGNWYQLRLKSAGGYGNWSDSFKVGAAQGYPDAGDIQSWLTAAGFTFALTNAAQTAQMELFDSIARAGRQIVEQRTGRTFLGDGTNTTRYFAAPTGRSGLLRIDDLASLNTVTYQPTGQVTATTWVLYTDFWPEPDNYAARGLPITGLRLRQRWAQPLAPAFQRAVIISGQWGYSTRATGLPESIWSAMVAAGCLELWGTLAHSFTGGLLSWQEADVHEDYGVEPMKRLRDAWQSRVETVVRLYRRWEI